MTLPENLTTEYENRTSTPSTPITITTTTETQGTFIATNIAPLPSNVSLKFETTTLITSSFDETSAVTNTFQTELEETSPETVQSMFFTTEDSEVNIFTTDFPSNATSLSETTSYFTSTEPTDTYALSTEDGFNFNDNVTFESTISTQTASIAVNLDEDESTANYYFSTTFPVTVTATKKIDEFTEDLSTLNPISVSTEFITSNENHFHFTDKEFAENSTQVVFHDEIHKNFTAIEQTTLTTPTKEAVTTQMPFNELATTDKAILTEEASTHVTVTKVDALSFTSDEDKSTISKITKEVTTHMFNSILDLKTELKTLGKNKNKYYCCKQH